jgi:DNA-binding response OmpR family regulator
MASRILIVEDDPDIAGLIAMYLRKAGYLTEILASGRDALSDIAARPPDLAILDVMLPHMDGLDVCRAVRANPRTSALPIIMLTARTEETDRIVGLEIGADDYVAKPFSRSELVARVRALLRRASRSTGDAAAPPLAYGPLSMDIDRHTVSMAGGEVPLAAKEFLLLEYLLRNRGRVMSRDRLLSDVWGYQYTGGTRTVDVHVRRLREKLPLLAEALVTVKQFGYKLVDPPPDPARSS